MQLVMGIDIGTSSVKVVVADWQRGLLARSVRGYRVLQPSPGYAEQNPQDWLESAIAAIRDIDADLLQQVAGISFAGQMHAVVAVDEKFQPLTNALLWFDTRAQPIVDRLTGEVQASSAQTLQPDPTLPLAKIRWLHDCGQPDWRQVRYVLGAKDWVRCQFGGSARTDYSEASGTQLLNVQKLDWDKGLVHCAGLTPGQLPGVTHAASPDGQLSPELARRTGLPEGCPLFVGGGDLPVAMGLLDLGLGDVAINIGTSGQIVRRVECATSRKGCSYFASARLAGWLELIPLLSVGMSLKWWYGILGESVQAAVQSAHSGKLGATERPPLLFLPHLAGERPWHQHPLSSGGFWGLRTEHDAKDLSQAVLEGLALSLYEAYQTLWGEQGGKGSAGRIFLTGSQEFTQLLGDELSAVVGQPLYVRRYAEPTAQGAAFLAWLGLRGQVQGQPPNHWANEEVVSPDSEKAVHYKQLYPRYLRARELQAQLWSRDS